MCHRFGAVLGSSISNSYFIKWRTELISSSTVMQLRIAKYKSRCLPGLVYPRLLCFFLLRMQTLPLYSQDAKFAFALSGYKTRYDNLGLWVNLYPTWHVSFTTSCKVLCSDVNGNASCLMYTHIKDFKEMRLLFFGFLVFKEDRHRQIWKEKYCRLKHIYMSYSKRIIILN